MFWDGGGGRGVVLGGHHLPGIFQRSIEVLPWFYLINKMCVFP